MMQPKAHWAEPGAVISVNGRSCVAGNTIEAESTKRLHQPFLSVIKKTTEGNATNTNCSNSSLETLKRVEGVGVSPAFDRKGGSNINSSNGHVQSTGGRGITDVVKSMSLMSQSTGSSSIPEFLTGFEKFAPSLLPPIDMANVGQSPLFPTFTTKSFDDLHKFLGSYYIPLNPPVSSMDKRTRVEGPASEALHKKQKGNVSIGVTKPFAQVIHHHSLPKPILACPHFPEVTGGAATFHLAHNGPVTADDYAIFAQQSVLAVSQHSAYCYSQPQSDQHLDPDSKKIGFEMKGAPIGSQVVVVIEDDINAAGGSRFNAENLKAHSKAAEARNGPLPLLGINDSLVRERHKHAQSAVGCSGEFMASGLTRHATLVSGSEKSDMGTESESIISSSRLSSIESGSENTSDHGSDNSSLQSEYDGSEKAEPQPKRRKRSPEICCH